MKKTIALLHFYKSIFILPLVITFIPVFISSIIPFAVVILTKILIFGSIWFYKYVEDREDKKFYFYYNNGLTKTNLFLFSFFLDLIIALIINALI